MELRQLEYFITAARLGNLTKAAELHYVSQPNITVVIKKLEEELGTKLFTREYKKVTLTPKGKRFYEAILPLLSNLQNIVDEIKDTRDKESGTITLGIPPMIGTFTFAPLITYFRNTHPHWELMVVEDGSIGLRQRLLHKELDLALVIIDKLDDTIDALPLFTAEHKLCVPRNHPLAAKEEIPFSDLRNEPLIMMRLDSFHRQRIFDECAKAGFAPQIALSSNHIQSNIDSVASGIGLSFLLDKVTLHRDDVVLRSTSPRMKVTVGIAWPRNKYLSYASRDIISYLTDLYQTGEPQE